MEMVYVVIFSLIALILLFGASYLLALVLNKVSENAEWLIIRETVRVSEETVHTNKEDHP
ncbi:hypothetical protein [Aneurinibacillus terranovensis]|uniref:hypothetical protein n=1 Tax=Aneurinibacillus terranovensis TaxID=278991 RepID=UPI00040EC4E6|nr:hypothetical protein [Aneurinibacillus terranovensis]